MSEKTILAPHIAVQPGVRGGRPFIDGKGIAVSAVARWHYELGMPVDEVLANFDLTPAQFHGALAFYWDHKAEIDARAATDEALVEDVRRGIEPRSPGRRAG